MNKKLLISISVGMSLAAIVVIMFFRAAGKADSENRSDNSSIRQKTVAADTKTPNKISDKPANDLDKPLDDFEKSLSKKDQAIYIPLSRALDDENLDGVVKYAALAADSDNEDIRQHAVEALAWFEEKAVEEMLPFLLDPSEAVAADAKRRFTDILDGMEDEDGKLKIVSSVMRKLKASDLLDEMANRIVLTRSSDKAVETLADLTFYGNTDVRKKAMEAYREVTGEVYQGRQKALEWARANKEN